MNEYISYNNYTSTVPKQVFFKIIIIKLKIVNLWFETHVNRIQSYGILGQTLCTLCIPTPIQLVLWPRHHPPAQFAASHSFPLLTPSLNAPTTLHHLYCPSEPSPCPH